MSSQAWQLKNQNKTKKPTTLSGKREHGRTDFQMRFPTNATPTRKVGHHPLQPERWQALQKLGDIVVQESPEGASAAAVHISVCVSRQGLQIILGSCSVRCPPPSHCPSTCWLATWPGIYKPFPSANNRSIADS